MHFVIIIHTITSDNILYNVQSIQKTPLELRTRVSHCTDSFLPSSFQTHLAHSSTNLRKNLWVFLRHAVKPIMINWNGISSKSYKLDLNSMQIRFFCHCFVNVSQKCIQHFIGQKIQKLSANEGNKIVISFYCIVESITHTHNFHCKLTLFSNVTQCHCALQNVNFNKNRILDSKYIQQFNFGDVEREQQCINVKMVGKKCP